MHAKQMKWSKSTGHSNSDSNNHNTAKVQTATTSTTVILKIITIVILYSSDETGKEECSIIVQFRK